MKYLPFLILIVLFSNCSKSGTKALEKGNYYEAVIQSVEKLKKNTDNEKSTQVLPEAYKMASRELNRDIEKTKTSNFPFRWERALEYYDKLNRMHDLIERCTACRRLVSPQSYFKEAEEARDNAGNERYALAMDLMKRKSIESGREAYKNLEELYKFAPNFKDVRFRMEEALNMGSVHVVVEQPKINSRLYQYSNEFFQGKIDEFLNTNRRMNKFIRFYTPNEAKNTNLKPDHIVRLEFIDFIVGESIMNSDRSTVTSKDSVKTGEATIDGKKVPVYGKVNAQLTKFRKAVRSRGILLMEVFDYQNNRSLMREEVGGEYNWGTEWASFNGDERALTENDKRLCQRREELPPPPQQMFIEFCKPIYDQTTSRLKRFYDKY
jgi:tetratricopeptide (TPR) repeat protein